MRQSLPALLLALSPCLIAPSAIAQEAPSSVIEIDDALFGKHSELKEAKQNRDAKQQELDSQQQKLDDFAKQAKSGDAALEKAKARLERDYQRMIDEPELDLSASQARYQEAWGAVKQNQVQRLEAEQQLSELELALQTAQAQVDAVQTSIDELNNSKLRARAERLTEELSGRDSEKVSFTNVCQSNMTLAQCASQTSELALQKAVKQFQKALIDNTSESNLVKQNLNKVSLNIHVLNHKVSESGFYDGVRYRTIMDVNLEARPSATTACNLLDLDAQYCFAPGSYSGVDNKQVEVAWVTLTVRSNKHNDKVTINGVNYGSTPLDVMLPIGQHIVTVQKEGYYSFNQELKIKSDQTLRAVLREKENELVAGHKFADQTAGDARAPEMITLLSGEYFIGESSSRQIHLDHAFAIGATPITVSQFDSFVNSTNYQTDAELKNTCTTIENSEITPVPNSYWRNPGFKQHPNSPAVCISRNDANAYLRWLSKQTGYDYRLPTEDEWEVASLAGSQSAYWWGNEFESGKANTGWGGTPWSNKSTAPVSAFAPNTLGLYDMVGNVWQWTNDSRGLAKGGAWNFSPSMAQAHQKLFLSTSSAANYVGFRAVRKID
ncbi:SUMF1/EgtB/PvdO family nonheme iron enzyme [Vibrio mexicanus]|uniref:SUMF1/EgtB/PvdO family nonheme iron enzyme n=1 Tax=Vibrio mexicanus TaxID=1004326 RepID=UPI00063C6A32|nr:SUMF1/EgtB/PvdO family nonheme iron enzyme [Vibrio mexicanus]